MATLACVLLLLAALAPLARQPASADRLGDLDLFLGAPAGQDIALRAGGPTQRVPPPRSRVD